MGTCERTEILMMARLMSYPYVGQRIGGVDETTVVLYQCDFHQMNAYDMRPYLLVINDAVVADPPLWCQPC